MSLFLRTIIFLLIMTFITSCTVNSVNSDIGDDQYEYIYFTAHEYRDGPKNLYMYKMLSGEVVQLSAGDRVYYYTFMDDSIGYYKQDQRAFWTMTMSGLQQQFSFSFYDAYMLRPYFSKIDRKIYFYTSNANGMARTLCSVNSDGNGFTFIDQPEAEMNITQDLSSDGKRLLFKSISDGSFNIYTMDISTQQYEKILTQPKSIDEIKWTNDNKGIYFWRQENDSTRSIQYYDLQTQSLIELYTPESKYPIYLDNSPDDEKLVMACADSYRLDAPWELYILNIQTSETTKITNNGFLAAGLNWIESKKFP